MNTAYEKARTFIYRNARPLDLARWRYHFENGSREDVLTALAAYQNEDGGFGHALEDDCWNPNSSPIQTWSATKYLREIDFLEKEHPVVTGIINFLSSGLYFNGHFWCNSIPSNNDFPHASWWAADENYMTENNYNPTASLAGFCLLCADPASPFRPIALRVAQEAVDAYMADGEPEMHRLSCYLELAADLKRANRCDIVDYSAFAAKLKHDVNITIDRHPEIWNTEYVCKPSRFIDGPNSPFYPGNETLVQCECELIERTQLDDGSWAITWEWDSYPEEYAISANWWKSNFILENLLFLRGMGKL